MDHAAVLNIAARADANRIGIAANHAIVPDADVRADFDITNDPATRCNKSTFMDAGPDALEGGDENMGTQAVSFQKAQLSRGRPSGADGAEPAPDIRQEADYPFIRRAACSA
ncbi:hypothetical protein E4T56_gene6494 [Termitomyces sp. T112]|nr:hypothetical protein E4T56_gene6494 [Termitomyces sp. T112]